MRPSPVLKCRRVLLDELLKWCRQTWRTPLRRVKNRRLRYLTLLPLSLPPISLSPLSLSPLTARIPAIGTSCEKARDVRGRRSSKTDSIVCSALTHGDSIFRSRTRLGLRRNSLRSSYISKMRRAKISAYVVSRHAIVPSWLKNCARVPLMTAKSIVISDNHA